MLATAGSYSVIDSHTAGHPTRVILSGMPPLRGASVLAQRDDFRARFDHLRPGLLHEPAGHAAMVGLVPVRSEHAEFGAFFISSYVYLDMCGHGTIGYARTLAATGSIAAPRPSFTLETPAGTITVALRWAPDGRLVSVAIRNVACRVGLEGVVAHLPDGRSVRADIVYGGLWYAIVDAGPLDLKLEDGQVGPALKTGAALKLAVTTALRDADPALGGGSAPSVLLYATVSPLHARHMLVLAANKFDRSPCGTGTSARVALLAHRGEMDLGDSYIAENLLGTTFTARIVERTIQDGWPVIVPEIEGQAYITAFSTIVKEAGDPLGGGFLLR